jgi:hypothetical protein
VIITAYRDIVTYCGMRILTLPSTVLRCTVLTKHNLSTYSPMKATCVNGNTLNWILCWCTSGQLLGKNCFCIWPFARKLRSTKFINLFLIKWNPLPRSRLVETFRKETKICLLSAHKCITLWLLLIDCVHKQTVKNVSVYKYVVTNLDCNTRVYPKYSGLTLWKL